MRIHMVSELNNNFPYRAICGTLESKHMNGATIHQILPAAIAAIFAMVVVIFIIESIVLDYHWTKYGVRGDRLKKIRVVYFSVSAVIFVLIATFAAGALRLI